MRKSSPEDSSKKDVGTSDSDGDGDNDWDKALHRVVHLKVKKSEKDPEGLRLSLIKAYLNEGANINAQNVNGDTVLHMAVEKGFQRIVEFLRQRGAKTDVCNHNGETAIGLAEKLQEKYIVSTLQKHDEQRNEPGFSRPSGANNSMSAADKQQPSSSGGSDKATKQKPTTVQDDPKRIVKLHPSVDADNAEKVSGSKEQKTYLAGATLTRSWPGIVYQLKHLAFTLHCALQQRDPHFFLATEMVAAEKLDDVVLLYKNDSGKQVGRFVQIKYTSNQFRKISAKELLDAGGDFSVPTYLASWRKVKKKKLFRDIEVRNMILCTNMGFDVEDMAKNDICCENTGDPDKTFELRSAEKQTAYYKFSADKESNKKLYSELEAASDVCRLAKLVAKCIYDRSPMRLNMQSFRDYHLALAKYVFDVKTKKFHDKFIHNRSLTKNVEEFREIFLTEFRSMARSSNTDSSEELTWKEIQTRFEKPEFPKGFGKAPEGTTDILTEYYLPDDYVDDVEISNFLDEFTLAVDQPNGDELNKILREKIDANSGFNLLNTEILDGAFQNKMLDWFVKNNEDTKEKEYFSYIVGEKFFEDMHNEVSSLITIGVNSAYCEQIKEYDIHFKSEMQRVKAFLTEDQFDHTANRILELVAPGDTLLSVLRVHDTLGRIQKYKKMDSFIFTRVDSLKFPSILNLIKNTLESLRCPNLLIVDCGSNGTDQYLRTVWNSLCKIINENLQKKMIVITRTGEDLGTQFICGHETYHENNIDLGFHNLTNATQKKLLEKPVTKFQGHKNKTSLGELLGIREFESLSADELQDILEIIDTNALVKIIRSDQLELGDEMDTPEHCYINRRICRDVVIKEAIFEDKKIPDLIAISGINAVLQCTALRMGETFAIRQNFSTDLFADISIDKDFSGESVQIRKSPPMTHRPTNFTILDSNREEEHFNDLCAKHEGRNVHWLQKEQERYTWKKSRGDIAYLVQKRDLSGTDECNDKTGATHLSDDQIIFHDKPVIISDAAGMGKSTMLTYLACKMKDNEPDMLVLKIDLNHHSTALSEVREKSIYDLGIPDGAIQFLVDELLTGETDLARKVFRRIIERKNKVALIFDGFDEISPTYEGPVIDLLQTFADYGIKKLLVATRPHTRATLETKLNTFSYEIQPFSTTDQENFLTEFWRAQFQDLHHDLQQTADDRIKKYTRAMMIQLENLIRDQRNKFTGIPLHAKLVAEIFGNHSKGAREQFDSCIEFVNSEVDAPKFPEKINLVYLYENFVQKKFDVFYRKRGDNLADVAVIEDKRQRYKSFIEKHERLALDALFDKHKITEILLSRQDARPHRPIEPADHDIPVERDGIITQFIDGQPQFGHRTYAEYFAAKFFSDMLRKRQLTEPSGNIFVADILLGENHKTMRAFIDWLLPDEHVDVLDGEFWTLCLKTHRSQQQETIFHVAAAEGNDRIIRLFLDCLHSNSEDRMDLMNERDIFGGMAIHRAVEYGNLDKIKLLAEVTDVEIDSRNGLGFSPLHQAASIANIDIVKYLIQKGADINCRTNDSQTPLHVAPLHVAVLQGKLDVVKYLHGHGADINCQMNDGGKPLHLAALKGGLDVVEYLHEIGADLNCQMNDGITALHVAASKGKLDVVEYLHGHGADINCQMNDGATPLHLAAYVGKLDVVEYLHGHGADINCQMNDGRKPLHLAAQEGKLDVVKYIHGIGADINCQSNSGITALHQAASKGKLDVVEYLHGHGADINCQMNDGATPLHLAAYVGKLDVVEYLHGNGADINCQCNDGIKAIHLAAQEGELDVVKYLYENGAGINFQSNIGATPLHLAVLQGKLDVVKYLHGHGADINCQMNDGRQPLHLAAGKGGLDVVEYLHEIGADLNCQMNDGITALHLAVSEGKLDVVEYLHEHEADINCQMNDGRTPLHLATRNGQLDIVKYLHGKGAGINRQQNSGTTPRNSRVFTQE